MWRFCWGSVSCTMILQILRKLMFSCSNMPWFGPVHAPCDSTYMLRCIINVLAFKWRDWGLPDNKKSSLRRSVRHVKIIRKTHTGSDMVSTRSCRSYAQNTATSQLLQRTMRKFSAALSNLALYMHTHRQHAKLCLWLSQLVRCRLPACIWSNRGGSSKAFACKARQYACDVIKVKSRCLGFEIIPMAGFLISTQSAFNLLLEGLGRWSIVACWLRSRIISGTGLDGRKHGASLVKHAQNKKKLEEKRNDHNGENVQGDRVFRRY